MKLQNILDLDDYTSKMNEGKTPKISSCPWFQDCIRQVKIWICQDRTTTTDNLREKALNYAKNYLIYIPELSSINREEMAGDVADKVEKSLKDVCFDQRPPASAIAQKARMSVPEDPERRFIKL